MYTHSIEVRNVVTRKSFVKHPGPRGVNQNEGQVAQLSVEGIQLQLKLAGYCSQHAQVYLDCSIYSICYVAYEFLLILILASGVILSNLSCCEVVVFSSFFLI